MAEAEWATYALRVRPWVMEGLRRLAKSQKRSLNAVMGAALADYIKRQTKGRMRKTMRWQFDGTLYDEDTAQVIAHSGRGRYEDEPKEVLYKGSSAYTDEYWMVRADDEEGGREFVSLQGAQEAYSVYLGLHVHVMDEDEAFSFAEASAQS